VWRAELSAHAEPWCDQRQFSWVSAVITGAARADAGDFPIGFRPRADECRGMTPAAARGGPVSRSRRSAYLAPQYRVSAAKAPRVNYFTV
jgi:hypothetical protein